MVLNPCASLVLLEHLKTSTVPRDFPSARYQSQSSMRIQTVQRVGARRQSTGVGSGRKKLVLEWISFPLEPLEPQALRRKKLRNYVLVLVLQISIQLLDSSNMTCLRVSSRRTWSSSCHFLAGFMAPFLHKTDLPSTGMACWQTIYEYQSAMGYTATNGKERPLQQGNVGQPSTLAGNAQCLLSRLWLEPSLSVVDKVQVTHVLTGQACIPPDLHFVRVR